MTEAGQLYLWILFNIIIQIIINAFMLGILRHLVIQLICIFINILLIFITGELYAQFCGSF